LSKPRPKQLFCKYPFYLREKKKKEKETRHRKTRRRRSRRQGSTKKVAYATQGQEVNP
jgi:hypothetical protein